MTIFSWKLRARYIVCDSYTQQRYICRINPGLFSVPVAVLAHDKLVSWACCARLVFPYPETQSLNKNFVELAYPRAYFRLTHFLEWKKTKKTHSANKEKEKGKSNWKERANKRYVVQHGSNMWHLLRKNKRLLIISMDSPLK